MSDEKKITNHPQDEEPMSFTKGLKAMISKKAGYKSARRANKVILQHWVDDLAEDEVVDDHAPVRPGE